MPLSAEAPSFVKHFRQILVWPLQLMPIREGSQIQRHWEALTPSTGENPWHEIAEEIAGDPGQFENRHYAEFVTFLPPVQRFLFGEAQNQPGRGESPIRVFRRHDIKAVRLQYRPGEEPKILQVVRIDLFFFYDIDIAILLVEIGADDLSLLQAEETLYRFGRAYPPHWQADGTPSHCLHRVEWLGEGAGVLAVSDYEDRERYLEFVCRTRSPRIASHWEFVLAPLVPQDSDRAGTIRYRLVEYHRMPLMGYLALEDPRRLSRADFVRLGLVTEAGTDASLPYAETHLHDFEQRYCYDRYWNPEAPGPSTRFLCCGHALVVVGPAGKDLFREAEIGVLGQFRHQHFLMFLIAHFHKAALLMFSDRLVAALNRLNIQDAESVKVFKRVIRQVFEIFLRFSHRYWFHDISDQAQVKDLFRLCNEHLGTDRLYTEVREEIEDMSAYLDSDSLRRQANTVVRLTVVTTFGLIATVATGFLGMNLIAEAESPLGLKLLYFLLVLLPTTGLILFAILKSKRLSDFLEALSDERLPNSDKLMALRRVWGKRKEVG